VIPDYPWFGPRHGMGWAWAPVIWEGKLITAVVAVILAITVLTFGRSKKTLYIGGGCWRFAW
jgi:hypothetical protein